MEPIAQYVLNYIQRDTRTDKPIYLPNSTIHKMATELQIVRSFLTKDQHRALIKYCSENEGSVRIPAIELGK